MIKLPNLSPVDGLVDLACRDGVDVRPTLLRVLTDLYVQKPVHSADEVTQYVELALGLIDTVDSSTRAIVAATLSNYPSAPPAVMQKLGLAADGTPARMELPEVPFMPEAPVMAETPALAMPAAPAPIVTAPVITAPDSLTNVFFTAEPGERRLILANLDVVADPNRSIVPASAEMVMRLEHAALRREPLTFAKHLSRALGIRRELANRIASDASGEPIVVAAKALDIRAAVLQRILMFINPDIGQSVNSVFDLANLYDELTLSAAIHMVSLWRHDAPALLQRPRYEAMYQDDARTVRRPMAREVRRPDQSETATPNIAVR